MNVGYNSFTVGMHEARRVVRTEHNYCINQAELKGMKDAGFDEYEFASLGENADDVCHTCDDLDGERFKIEDAVVGVNCPPMYPFCRCKATTPMETKEDVQADIDRMLDGRSIEDIERELDRQIAEKEVEMSLSTALGDLNSQNQLTFAEKRDIINTRMKMKMDNQSFLNQFNTYDINSRTEEEKLAQVNPHYDEGKEWKTNCQRCVVAYEMIERGYDVTSKPYDPNDSIKDNPFLPWKIDKPYVADAGYKIIFNSSMFETEVPKFFEEWGEGSRAIIRVKWNEAKGGDHVFTAKYKNNSLLYIDPQMGKQRDIHDTLSECDSQTPIWIMRIDNRDFSELAIDAVQNNGG